MTAQAKDAALCPSDVEPGAALRSGARRFCFWVGPNTDFAPVGPGARMGMSVWRRK